MSERNTNHPNDEELDAAYRATATEAGRPDARTRAAILREAEAVARRRAPEGPAANDSRYLWRMVAGVAVVGVGLLIWRQTDHQLPGEQRTVSVPVQAEESAPMSSLRPERAGDDAAGAGSGSFDARAAVPPAGAADEGPAYGGGGGAVAANPAPVSPAPESAPADRSGFTPDPAAREGLERERARVAAATAESRREVDAELSSRAAKSTAESEQSARLAQADTRAAAPARPLMAQESQGAAAAAAPPAPPPAVAARARVGEVSTARLSTEEATRLLRENVPSQYQSAEAHHLWLLRDDGKVVLSGELEPGQRPDAVADQIGRGLQGRTPGPWQLYQLRNAAGQLVELSVADVELGGAR